MAGGGAIRRPRLRLSKNVMSAQPAYRETVIRGIVKTL